MIQRVMLTSLLAAVVVGIATTGSFAATNQTVYVVAKLKDDPQHNAADVEGHFTNTPTGDKDEIHVTQPTNVLGKDAGVYPDPVDDGANLTITHYPSVVMVDVEGRDGVGAMYWVTVVPVGGSGPGQQTILWADVEDEKEAGALVLKDKNSGRGESDQTNSDDNTATLYATVADDDGKGDVEFWLFANSDVYDWTIITSTTVIASGTLASTDWKSEKLNLDPGVYSLIVTKPGDTTFRRKIDFYVIRVDVVTFEKHASGNDLSTCPNNGDLRVFPGRPSTSSNSNTAFQYVRVKAQITPSVPDAEVFFKWYDVDDPSTDSNPVDSNGGGGDDNRDSSSVGLTAGGASICSATTDPNGIANEVFVVGRCPGDNYRVIATLNQDALGESSLQEVQSGTGLPMSVRRTPMLTVWRRLFLELDAMDVGWDSNAIGGANLDDTGWNDPHAGDGWAEVHGLNGTEEGSYEGGHVDVASGGNYEIIDAIDDTGDDTLYVDGNITGDEDKSADAWDDDVTSLRQMKRPRRKVNTAILNSKLAPAYIETNEVTNASDLDTPFIGNIGEMASDIADAAAPKKDLTTAEDCWVLLILCAHQAMTTNDFDPDAFYHYHSLTSFKQGETSPIFGRSPSPPVGFDQNVSVVFLETIRDYVDWEAWADGVSTGGPGGTLLKDSVGQGDPNYVLRTVDEIEQITAAHEVGVAFGLNIHGTDGIMMAGVTDPAQDFKPDDLAIMRNNGLSSSGPIGKP